jgi:5'-3' exonuclease
MGIKNINKVIAKHAPKAQFHLKISKLAGKRVAIDALLWIHGNMYAAQKHILDQLSTDEIVNRGLEQKQREVEKEFYKGAIRFVLKFLSYDVTPVFVFDGSLKPAEKEDTQLERINRIMTAKSKIEDLYIQVNQYEFAPVKLTDRLMQELKNHFTVDTRHIEGVQRILHGMSVPYLLAKGDAEQLCSMLCIEKQVAAVYSKDTDNLALGCPLLLTDFDYRVRGEPTFNAVRLDYVLRDTGMAWHTFVDLCIMAGCDFNTNMDGIAALTAYKIIKPVGCIEKLRGCNTECLNHVRCREIFKYYHSTTLTNTIPNLFVGELHEDLYDILDKIDLLDLHHDIHHIYQSIVKGEGGYVDELQLADSPNKPVTITSMRIR